MVSVVMTFLDTPAAFLDEAVASVEAQTFRDWELIMVNDGSGPAVTKHAEQLAARSPDRVRCITHADARNHGTPVARNLGARHARGAYVAFLDSDDVWLPTKLEEQVACFEQHPDAVMVFGRSVFWKSWDAGHDGVDDVPALGVRDQTIFAPPTFVNAVLRRWVLPPNPSSVMVRAADMAEVGGFDEAWPTTYEDQTLCMKLGLHGPVLAMDRIWARYRIHGDSVLQRATRQKLVRERKQFLEWLLRYTTEHGYDDGMFRRNVQLQLLASRIPGAPRLLRFVSRVAALPRRVRNRQ